MDCQWGCPPDDDGADDACDVDVVDECDADEEEADEREESKREPPDVVARALSAARDGGGGVIA